MEIEIFINCNPQPNACGKEPVIQVHKIQRCDKDNVKTFTEYGWKGKVNF